MNIRHANKGDFMSAIRTCLVFILFFLIISCTSNSIKKTKTSLSLGDKDVRNHNRDSLTVDTCLCQNRLISLFVPDSANRYVKLIPANSNKTGTLSYDPPPQTFGGISIIYFNDSCRILKTEYEE